VIFILILNPRGGLNMPQLENARPSGFARILRRRNSGGIVFCTVRWSGKEEQLMCEKDTTAVFETLSSCPIGSLVAFEGEWAYSRRGTLSIRVTSLLLHTDCRRELPDTHKMRSSVRYANRTTDLIINQEVFDFFRFMARSVMGLRTELSRRGYLEFITGTLQEEFEAGLATSFSTQAAFNRHTYHLSLTSELKLKRLIMAGMEHVFEIAQTFRNEGANAICSPEHTLLEAYSVGKRCSDMMGLVETLVLGVATELAPDAKVTFVDKRGEKHRIDFASKFECISFSQAYSLYVEGDRPCTLERLIELFPRMFVPGMPRYTWLMKVIETLLAPHMVQPTFLCDLPNGMSPFVQVKREDPQVSDRAFFMAGGLFLADIYTDENNRENLNKALAKQSGGKESKNPESFINLLGYGMPPTAGFGLGLRRLFLLFRGTLPFNIKETILYPL
jgi:lysyl-tRNA synthetase class 2